MKEVFDAIRGMVKRVVLKNVKDDGEMQTASVEVANGVWRDEVEIMQPYGFASSAPEDGALTLVIAVGADQGDLVALPVSNPSSRIGNLPTGAVAIYNKSGDKILILPDGEIEITAATSVAAKVNGASFKVSGDGIDFVGGYVRHNGVDIGDTHRHGGILPGGMITDPPVSE